ncbi:MAG: isochorismate synthase [Azospirillum sp.]|nr:isochorismate synthase [Azospirillum sp.]
MTVVLPAAASPDQEVGPAPSFVLISNQDCLVGLGAAQALPACARSDVLPLLPGFFADAVRRGGPPLLVGALPFDVDRPVQLFQPQRLARDPAELDAAIAASGRGTSVWHRSGWRLQAEPTADRYADAVSAALSLLSPATAGAAGTSDPPALNKVVLARSLVLEAAAPRDLGRLLRILQTDGSVTTFAVPLPAAAGTPPRVLVGATPELLLEKRGTRVRSLPLAGSARRRPDPGADRAAAAALAKSDKDLREHALVVEAILDGLSPYCRDLRAPAAELVSTATMWHLATRIDGQLRDATLSSLELVAVLHPTPAVCGHPRDRARAVIGQLETFDRGFFTGAVGWCDHHGDGRWLVAIRCAELCGGTARLYAGAGIVPGSLPQAEVAETDAKFSTMLNALQFGDDVVGSAGLAS